MAHDALKAPVASPGLESMPSAIGLAQRAPHLALPFSSTEPLTRLCFREREKDWSLSDSARTTSA